MYNKINLKKKKKILESSLYFFAFRSLLLPSKREAHTNKQNFLQLHGHNPKKVEEQTHHPLHKRSKGDTSQETINKLTG